MHKFHMRYQFESDDGMSGGNRNIAKPHVFLKRYLNDTNSKKAHCVIDYMHYMINHNDIIELVQGVYNV